MEACDVVNEVVPIISVWGADSSIHIYIKQDTWQYAISLEGHLRAIRGLNVYTQETDLKLTSCGEDGILEYESSIDPLERHGHFNILQLQSSFKIDAILTGYSWPVSSVQWIYSKILSCSLDCTVRIWSLDAASVWWMVDKQWRELNSCTLLYRVILSIP